MKGVVLGIGRRCRLEIKVCHSLSLCDGGVGECWLYCLMEKMSRLKSPARSRKCDG